MQSTCSFDGCNRPRKTMTWCHPHYKQYWRGEELRPLRIRQPIEQRFWDKVSAPSVTGCREWTAARGDRGYGQFFRDGRRVPAHRVAWELTNGPIPPGMVIDHLCANHGCVNPEHLRVVTQGQNLQHLTVSRSDNTSGVRGVTWDKARNAWIVHVGLGGRSYFGGRYSTLEEADAAARALRAALFTHDDHDQWIKNRNQGV